MKSGADRDPAVAHVYLCTGDYTLMTRAHKVCTANVRGAC